ncbi:MAG: hypothetical protein K6G11_03990, partial [Lachnospiraceae bacterium]|nr:hypothetical protein [Lachnospiraceae bacterium]
MAVKSTKFMEKKFKRRAISGLLSLAMVVTSGSWTPTPVAKAEESGTSANNTITTDDNGYQLQYSTYGGTDYTSFS